MRTISLIALMFPAAALAASGSNTALGIDWIDQSEPGAPAFAYTDISGTGTALVNPSDDDVERILAVFDFPLGGKVYRNFYVHTNGQVYFENGFADYTNDPLSVGDEQSLSPFWDDLDPGNGTGFILWEVIGDELIIQWDMVPRFPNDGAYNFQVILRTDGSFTYNYLTMDSGSGPDTGGSATVGLSNDEAVEQISYNDPLAVQDNGYYDFTASFAANVDTACPAAGDGVISFTAATPNGRVAILGSALAGSTAIPAGPCAGTATDLDLIGVVAMVRADANGSGILRGTHLDTDCGVSLQLLDMDTCTMSNAVVSD